MRVRPSDVLGITDPYEAYCLDDAVMTFGQYVFGKISDIKGKNEKQVEGQRLLLLRRLLSAEEKVQFRTPVATM